MPAKPKKSGRQNYNWNLIMNDYITDPGSSLRKISEKYGIRLTTVSEKSKADNWFATKKEYQEKVRVKAAEKVGAKKANELANLVEASSMAADAILDALKNDPDYFYKHIISDNLTEKNITLTSQSLKTNDLILYVLRNFHE